MKILFITSNRLGDAVLSTGVLAELANQHPGAEVTVVCGPYAAGLFRAVPNLQKIIVVKKRSWNRHWLAVWRATILTRWDIIIDFRNSIISRLLFSSKKHYSVRNIGQHKVSQNSEILELEDVAEPHIWLDETAQNASRNLLPHDRLILALGPGANWPAKQWPPEKFGELAALLTEAHGPMREAIVLVIAGRNERPHLEPLLKALPTARKIELIEEDLLTIAACLGRSRLFIGNDSGLMHLAAAMGTPTIGLFGPGYEDIYGPWGQYCTFVRTPEDRDELLKKLPYPGAKHPNLMGSLEVETVFNESIRLLTRSAKRA